VPVRQKLKFSARRRFPFERNTGRRETECDFEESAIVVYLPHTLIMSGISSSRDILLLLFILGTIIYLNIVKMLVKAVFNLMLFSI
jgi:hypothetical protein